MNAITKNTSYPLPGARSGHRIVPATVGKAGSEQTIYVECPAWCTVDHTKRVAFAEDISHDGQRTALTLTGQHPAWAPLEVYLSWWPSNGKGEERPLLAVDLDSEVETYGRTAALAMADQLVAFAADVRRLAQALPDDRPIPIRSQADEALRRIRGGQA
ncbi:DUF6907 domain-containing protein [Streptomyces sp. 7R007]